MSGGTDDATPPITRPSPTPAAPPPPGVSRTALIWMGVAVVVLSFVAAFLGSWLARSTESVAEPSPTPTAEPVQTTPPDYEAIIEDILPAGSAVRAGTGAPESGKGSEGDIYIDRSTADVYLFQDDWVWVGNIRASAAANLTGAAGAAGPSGAPGAPGASGAPGAPGTQVLLGVGAPDDDTCEADGDVYIDTEVSAYYECRGGAWTLFGPTSAEGGD